MQGKKVVYEFHFGKMKPKRTVRVSRDLPQRTPDQEY